MTQVFTANGDAVPVTIVLAGPCFVTQIKEKNPAGRRSVQVGFEELAAKKLSKPQVGHLKNLPAVRTLREFEDSESELKRGDKLTIENFKVGERVDVVGISKGKGFQGVVRRHGFAGGPASHGHKDNLRAPGTIGAGGVQRVFKGLRMGGHMGDDQITVQNLEIVEMDLANNILKIRGALPGARNSLVVIKAKGTLKAVEEKKEEEKNEEPKIEESTESQVESVTEAQTEETSTNL